MREPFGLGIPGDFKAIIVVLKSTRPWKPAAGSRAIVYCLWGCDEQSSRSSGAAWTNYKTGRICGARLGVRGQPDGLSMDRASREDVITKYVLMAFFGN